MFAEMARRTSAQSKRGKGRTMYWSNVSQFAAARDARDARRSEDCSLSTY